MANRAYLYTANKDLSILRDVSENRSEIPLAYQILLSVDTKQENSQIWTYEQPIAISANFEGGIARLDAFYDYLKTQSSIDTTKISEYQAEMHRFFEEHADRKLDRFFMEGGEAYDLIASEEYTIEKENEYQYLMSMQIGSHLATILTEQPDNLFAHKETYKWLAGIQEDITCLEVYWSKVTYFSFNKTGTTA